MMKEEIGAAVTFVSKLVQRGANVTEERMAKFESRLGQLLEERFSNHWHPERPWRGQGYRCLRVNESLKKEPMIDRAAWESGLNYDDLNLPVELTIWVDPEEVACRFGEHKGSYCTVASFREGNKENYIDQFDYSKLERPNRLPQPSSTSKPCEVLKERSIDSSSNMSPPSSTQSTPSKKKPFSPTHFGFGVKNQTSPGRTAGNVNVRDRRPFGNQHNHYSMNHHSHTPQNGSYSPPFKTQSWVNLSQTPPPPPPPHLPLFSSTGFLYPPTTPPHYTHTGPHFTRSPPHLCPQKFKWNNVNYTRSDRHQWFGHRALARV